MSFQDIKAKMRVLFNIKTRQWFFGLLIAIAFVYNYNHILFERPVGVHQWRNSVSAAFAYNSYMEGDVFRTRTNALLADNNTSDITIVEFPIIYTAVSLLYKIFGPHEFLFRLFQVLIGFIGLYYLFKASYLILGNKIYAAFIPLIIFSSPIYVFYLNNFIPDAASLSITFIGIYFFFKFFYQQKQKYWFISMLFLALAGLVKSSSLLFYFALGFILLMNLIVGKKYRFKGIPTHIKYLASYLGVLILIIAWYAYAKIYSDIHDGSVSAVELRPIWVLSSSTIKYIWEAIALRFRNGDYHSSIFLIVSAILAIVNLFFFRRKNLIINLFGLLILLGAIAFTMAFYRSMHSHGYYQICNLQALVFIYLNTFLILKSTFSKIYNSIIPKIILAVAIVLLVFDCQANINKRYSPRDGHYVYSKSILQMYGNLTPYLRELGIERKDVVFSSPDPSINISLYLMDQKGFTDFGPLGQDGFDIKLEKMKEAGLKYAIIGDTAGFAQRNKIPFKDVYFGEQIGQYGPTRIYKVSNDSISIQE